MNDLIITKIEGARALLAQASNAQEAKRVVDLAHAAEIYAKRQHLSDEAIAYAHEVKIDAQRLLGEFLQDAGIHAGQPAKRIIPSENNSFSEPPKLPDIGITLKESSQAQQIATLAMEIPELFERVRGGKVSVTQARRETIRRKAKAAPPLPNAKYRVIYADPPWAYSNTMPEGTSQPDDHYPAKPLKDICVLPIKDLAEDNAVLFLWTTSPHLEESFQVVKAWGFSYKASFVWDKVKHNMGHYNSVRHEFLLVCTRGSCQPDVHKLYDSVVSIERGEHSVKPEYFREMIDTLYPVGKRIELFGRKQVAGWDVFGNDIS